MIRLFSVISALCLLVYAFLVMWLILDVHIEDVTKKKRVSTITITGAMLISNIFVLLVYGYKTYTSFYPILAQIPVFIIFILLSRYRGTKLLFMLLSTIVFSSPPVIIAMSVSSFFKYNKILQMSLQILCYPLMLILIKKLFVPLFTYMLDNCNKGWLGFSTVPAIYYFMTFLSSKYYYTSEYWDSMKLYRISLCVLIFAVYLLILYLFKQTREQLILQNEANVFKLQAEAATDKLDQISQSQEQMKIYRHDIRHHLQYINSCVENNQISEIKPYIHTLCEQIDNTKIEQFCENKAVNLIISSYACHAFQNDIAFHVKADIPEILKLPNIELCVILGNVLENAINACEKLNNSRRKHVYVTAQLRNGKVFLSVKNPYVGEVQFENGIPITSEKGHGIGVKSVAELLKKHDGMCNFSAKDGVFSFMMLV